MADKFVVRIESTSIIFNWTHPYKTPSYSKKPAVEQLLIIWVIF